jgi:hypothetical protein
MPTIMELRPRGVLPYPRIDPAVTAKRQSTVAASQFAAQTNSLPQAEPGAPKRTAIPERYMLLEPKQPLSVIDDAPVFDAVAAARILGVSVERMKKWRQRNQGPDYIQYGKDGTVRYELTALMAYRAAHRVQNGSKP